MATIKSRQKVRHGSSAAWSSANPVLVSGEIAFESDTKRIRVGDGTTQFTSLSYIQLNTVGYQAVSAVLSSLALLGAANKGVYFSAANVMSEFALTALGRTLIGKATEAEMRAVLAYGALAEKNSVAFADIDPAAVISDVETLAANKVANAVPVAKAVTDYVDARFWNRRSFVPTTSGNVFDEAAIPAGINRMRLIIDNMSLSGSEDILIQLGTAGGFVVSGYSGSSLFSATSGSGVQFTNGLGIFISGGVRRITGAIDWDRPDPTANRWNAIYTMDVSDGAKITGGTRIDLGAALTQLRVTRTGTIPGTQAFDSGGFRLEYSI